MADIASDRSTTATLALGQSLDSAIDSDGDTDLVRVELVAGQSYAFDLLGSASGHTLADPVLTLLDAALATVAFDDDSGLDLDARIEFTAPASGTYYLRAAGYEGTGTYRLAMAAATPRSDDHGQTTQTAGLLAIGGAQAGTIESYGDRDWYRVDLAAGDSYAFALRGAGHGEGTLADPRLALHDAAGTLIDANDDAGDGTLDSLIAFTPTVSGAYYLDAAAFGDGLGVYRLSATVTARAVATATADATSRTEISGTGGNDSFVARGGTLSILGGDGVDTVRYAGLAQSYTRAVANGAGTISGGVEGGTTTLDSVEVIRFADGYFTSDAYGQAAQVARLYHLVLERAPDSKGLNDWVHMLEHGGSLRAVADGFAGSAEFQANTVGLNTADFVEFLYNGALGRGSDPSGKTDWTSALDGGRLTRGDVIVGFSESAEYHQRVDAKLGSGFFVYDETHAAISSLYDAFSIRLPDREGLGVWVEAARSGSQTMAQIADGFAHSAEFQQNIAGLNERGIVEQLYRNVLNREGDPTGIDAWSYKLSVDHDIGGLLLDFARSDEHQMLMQPYLADGIVYI